MNLYDYNRELILKSQALNSALNAVAFADLKGKLTYVNPSFLRLWGYSNDMEVLGRSALDFWKEEEKAKKAVKSLREEGSWRPRISRHRLHPRNKITQPTQQTQVTQQTR